VPLSAVAAPFWEGTAGDGVALRHPGGFLGLAQEGTYLLTIPQARAALCSVADCRRLFRRSALIQTMPRSLQRVRDTTSAGSLGLTNRLAGAAMTARSRLGIARTRCGWRLRAIDRKRETSRPTSLNRHRRSGRRRARVEPTICDRKTSRECRTRGWEAAGHIRSSRRRSIRRSVVPGQSDPES
jgi:hypothetical protein